MLPIERTSFFHKHKSKSFERVAGSFMLNRL